MLNIIRNTVNLSISSSSQILRSFCTNKKWLFKESDIEEKFILGWGPGGQKINRTANCVFLKHIPTGILVKCQDGRDIHKNQKIARLWLNEKLDVHLNGENSEVMKYRNELRARKLQKHTKAKKRLEAKIVFKEREGLIRKTVKEDEESNWTC